MKINPHLQQDRMAEPYRMPAVHAACTGGGCSVLHTSARGR
jgi:hypothetical protein